jgi:hypothetical protein
MEGGKSEGIMEPVIALCVLTLFVWAVAIVATFGEESEGTDSTDSKERENHCSDETEQRKAA